MSKYVNSNNEVYEGDLDLQVLRHTASHIMAQAIKRLFPQAKLAIGPAIENGFYYDIDVEPKLVEADLEKIEAEMKKIKCYKEYMQLLLIIKRDWRNI